MIAVFFLIVELYLELFTRRGTYSYNELPPTYLKINLFFLVLTVLEQLHVSISIHQCGES